MKKKAAKPTPKTPKKGEPYRGDCHPNCARSAKLVSEPGACQCACQGMGHGSKHLAGLSTVERQQKIRDARKEIDWMGRLLDIRLETSKIIDDQKARRRKAA